MFRLRAKTDEVEELRNRLTGLAKAKEAEAEDYEVFFLSNANVFKNENIFSNYTQNIQI